MATFAWIIMTSAEKDMAETLNGGGVAVIPREIANPLADNLGEGDLLGKFVAPARLLNDPDYVRWVDTLGVLPIRIMDSEVLFLPEVEEEE